MTGSSLAALGARAVLFGAESHVSGSELPDLPSVDTTLRDLERTLVEVCGMASGNVVRLPPRADAAQVIGAVEEAASAGGGPVLFYYVGHGLLGPRDDLYLATRATRSARHVAQSVSYRTISDLLGDAGSGSLVVLDCCFSGRAGTPPSEGGVRGAFASAGPRGSFLLTSASHYALSFAPEGERHTLFTGQLLELLEEGDPGGPLWLTADRLHDALDERFADDGRVNPGRQSEGTLGSLVFTRNRAYLAPPTGNEPVEAPADIPCPYPGLQPYRMEDSAYFFGREDLTARLMEQVDDMPDGDQVVLVGSSGAGKSSLLRAGLLAERKARTGAQAPALLLPAPGPHPMRTLTEAWARATERDPGEVKAELENGVFPTPRHNGPACGLLVVDQFEEVFTRCDAPEERSAFISLLTEDGPTRRPRVVLALRADHYGSCLEHPGLERALARAQLVVPPLRDQELRATVEGPAAAVGLAVQPGLTDRLLDDLRSGRALDDAATALPFLAHALRETWRGRSGVQLTLSAYQATGGIWKSVATTAKRLYESLGDGQATMRALLLCLVHLPPDGGAAVLRHRVPLAKLPSGSSQLRNRLAEARLLTMDQNTVQISHEALLRAWPLLHLWIQEDAAALLLRQQLEGAAEEWDVAGRDAAFLFRGSRLQAAAELAERVELPVLESEFLAAGQAEATRERRREQRQTRRLKRALAGVAIGMCLAIIAAVVAVKEQRNAEAQQQAATARALLAEANSLGPSDPRTILKLGLAAYALLPSAEARRTLFDTLADSAFRGVHKLPVTPMDSVLARDGRMLATWEAGHWTVWDTSRVPVPHTPLARLPCPRKDTGRADISFGGPGDHMAVAVCNSEEVRLWDLAGTRRAGEPRPVATLRAKGLKARTAGPSVTVLSPDGNTVATLGWSRYVGRSALVRWDVRVPQKPRQLPVVDETSKGRDLLQKDRMVFSADGRLLATADTHGDVRLWDVSVPREAKPLGSVKDAGGGLAFSPNGHLLAGSDGRKIKVIDVRSPRNPAVLDEHTAHTDLVSSLDFSPDSRRLISTGWDSKVTVWDLSNPRDATEESTLNGHYGYIDTARFRADGRSLISVSNGEVIHWDLADLNQPLLLKALRNGDQLALTPDGGTLAVARGAEIDLWDLADPVEPRQLAAVTNPVKDRYKTVDGGSIIGTGDVLADIGFSPDGALLAAMNHDRRITLWDVSDPTRPRITNTLRGAEGALGPSLAFAPDRPLLAVNDLKKVRIWDVSDPTRPRLTASHAVRITRDISFSPDGDRLLLAGQGLTVWNLRSGKTTLLSGGHLYKGGARAAFSPRKDEVAAVDGLPSITEPTTGFHLWDVGRDGGARAMSETDWVGTAGEKLGQLTYHPDGNLLAGAGEDGIVRVWSIAEPERAHPAFTFGGHSERVDEVVLGGPDGRTMVTSSAGHAFVFSIGDYPEIAADTIGMACRAAGGEFTRKEWETRVPETEYRSSCRDFSAEAGSSSGGPRSSAASPPPGTTHRWCRECPGHVRPGCPACPGTGRPSSSSRQRRTPESVGGEAGHAYVGPSRPAGWPRAGSPPGVPPRSGCTRGPRGSRRRFRDQRPAHRRPARGCPAGPAPTASPAAPSLRIGRSPYDSGRRSRSRPGGRPVGGRRAPSLYAPVCHLPARSPECRVPSARPCRCRDVTAEVSQRNVPTP
ncbi:caspase, EACC1-associated type [Streptomyces parvus]